MCFCFSRAESSRLVVVVINNHRASIKYKRFVVAVMILVIFIKQLLLYFSRSYFIAHMTYETRYNNNRIPFNYVQVIKQRFVPIYILTFKCCEHSL